MTNTAENIARLLQQQVNPICSFCPPDRKRSDSYEQLSVRSNVRAFAAEKFEIWRCPHCRSIHSLAQVDLPYYYSKYPLINQKLDLPTRLAYRNRAAPLLASKLPKDARILDYGCGQGLFLKYLSGLGFTNLAGYDPFCPAFSDTKALSRQYDCVIAQDVIEHLDEPLELMTQISKLLLPDGMAVIGTPRADDIDLNNPEFFSLELHQPYHRHIFSERALELLGNQADLKMRSVNRRFYFDTLVPGINARFIWEYVYRADRTFDCVFEPIKFDLIRSDPRMIFFALFGYFFPTASNMTAIFQPSAAR